MECGEAGEDCELVKFFTSVFRDKIREKRTSLINRLICFICGVKITWEERENVNSTHVWLHISP